jgi:integrase
MCLLKADSKHAWEGEMAKGRITKRAVDTIKSGERDTYLWDADLSGFGLKVTPVGSKVYLVQFRLGGRKGRTRRVTIGRHGSPWTPESARKEAKRLLGEVGAGRDPAEKRSQARRDLTIAELCDLYLAEGCTDKKPSTLATDRGRIERHIKPLLGRRKVASISGPDVRRFLQDVASGKTAADIKTGKRGRAIVEGGKGTATRTVGLLGGILTFAVEREIRPDNPVRGVKRFSDKKYERFLSPPEMAQLGDALSAALQDGESPLAVAAIRLLVLTGARKSEILTLKWEYVDTERGCLRLPDSKSGAKIIPVGAAALEALSDIARIEGNPYVLPGLEGRHFVGLQKIWERIRKRAGLEDVRLHDLRHSFASVAVAGGDSLFLVGKVLGHQHASTTERYAHIADDPLKAVADKTAAHIATAMKKEVVARRSSN